MALGVRSRLWGRAQRLIPGGVNSPVRAMKAVGLDEPIFVRRAEGAYLETEDGERLVDWVQSWGALLFGHADSETVDAVREAALGGTSYGAPTEREVLLADEIVDAVPSVEMVRLVSSGTEAAMSAIRLARGATLRPAGTASSSSPAATTATSTRCSPRRGRVSRRSGSQRRREFRPR
jgi:glutamate-1-semialdehyde 2,1-aminomutase